MKRKICVQVIDLGPVGPFFFANLITQKGKINVSLDSILNSLHSIRNFVQKMRVFCCFAVFCIEQRQNEN